MFFLPEVAWYVYGSVFIYSDAINPCRANEELLTKMLFITTTVLIIYTYLYFLVLAIVLIIFFLAYIKFSKSIKLKKS